MGRARARAGAPLWSSARAPTERAWPCVLPSPGFVLSLVLKPGGVDAGEPLSDDELSTAFKAMDINKSGQITFDDFLAWCANSGRRRRKRSSPLHACVASCDEPPPPPAL